MGILRAWQILNVQVPFYFKSIVDSMNIDFMALGGTAWTVGGTMILACMRYLYGLMQVADSSDQMEQHE